QPRGGRDPRGLLFHCRVKRRPFSGLDLPKSHPSPHHRLSSEDEDDSAEGEAPIPPAAKSPPPAGAAACRSSCPRDSPFPRSPAPPAPIRPRRRSAQRPC